MKLNILKSVVDREGSIKDDELVDKSVKVDTSVKLASNANTYQTRVGGQALIEGVMMMGPSKTFSAYRLPNREIKLEELPRPKKDIFTKIPFVRGVISLFRQLIIGTKAMIIGAKLQEEEALAATEDAVEDAVEAEVAANSEDAKVSVEMANDFLQRAKANKLGEKSEKDSQITNLLIYGATVFGLLMGIFLFIILPHLLSHFLAKLVIHYQAAFILGYENIFLASVEGILRLFILIVYLYLLRLQKDTYRLWQYHGAEHKSIACYEQLLPLTVANARSQSRFHPRCGTSFLFQVLFLSIFLFSFLGSHNLLMNVLLRLICMPLLAAFAFELLQWSQVRENTWLGKIIITPGLWVQKLTTAEPDDEHLEVAIKALEAVLSDN